MKPMRIRRIMSYGLLGLKFGASKLLIRKRFFIIRIFQIESDWKFVMKFLMKQMMILLALLMAIIVELFSK